MTEFVRLRLRSFRYAFAGWWYVIRTQRNAWLHTIATVMVLMLAFWLRLAPVEWAVLFITITMVWMAEFLNTALEAVVDLASPQHHPLAKIGKDVGAAAVLITALAAVLVGLLIIGPPLLAQVQQLLTAAH
jgi:diacylglycerol kinase (ATP)